MKRNHHQTIAPEMPRLQEKGSNVYEKGSGNEPIDQQTIARHHPSIGDRNQPWDVGPIPSDQFGTPCLYDLKPQDLR